MKIALFTHNDLDGFGSILILECLKRFQEKMNYDYIYEICNYNNINEKVDKFIEDKKYNNYDYVFITDISVSKNIADKIENLEKKNIFLFDHHKTAIENLKNYKWCYLDDSKSGSLIFWNNFFELGRWLWAKNFKWTAEISVLRHIINLISNYDLWKWKDLDDYLCKECLALNILFKHFDIKEFLDFLLYNYIEDGKMYENDIRFYNDIVITLNKEKEKYFKRKLSKVKYKKDRNNIKYAMITADNHMSELGSIILENDFDVKYVYIIGDNAVSLRSRKGEFDVSIIAEKYGGGGHQSASGFNINKEIINLYYSNIK